MVHQGLYKKNISRLSSSEIYLRVRRIEGERAVCDEMVLAKYQEDDRIYHNLIVPVSLLETGYHSLDHNNPVVDLLYPISL